MYVCVIPLSNLVITMCCVLVAGTVCFTTHELRAQMASMVSGMATHTYMFMYACTSVCIYQCVYVLVLICMCVHTCFCD